MTLPTHTLWSDAEALFTSAFSWTDALSSTAEAVGQTVTVGAVVAAAVLALVGLALRVRAPRRPRPVSPTLPVLMTRTLLLLAALLVAAPAFAQTHADPMARLAPFEGTYTLDGTPHMEPDGSFDGTLTIAPTLGGRFQQWDWEMTMRGPADATETVHLRFIVGYNPATRAYTIHRFDSRDADSPTRSAGALDSSQGRLQVNGDALVMAWTMENPSDSPRNGSFRNRVRVTEVGLLIETEGAPDDGSPVVAIATTRAARR